MTALYGIFGWPVAHTRSPAMQAAAFAALGIDAVYVPFAVPPDRLARAVASLDAVGIAGLNITVPHKGAILPMLSHVEAGARAIGAVNTVWREGGAPGGALVGGNTDAEGLARSLAEAGVALGGTRAVVLGAGGAARASVVGLAGVGVGRIVVAARRREQADVLVGELRAACGATELAALSLDDAAVLREELRGAALLVQATSATLGGHDAATAQRFADALPLDVLPASAAVCDLVYQPRRTAVLVRAEAHGLRTIDGLGMLLHQGAIALERWTGRRAPLDVMRAALG